MPQGISNGLVGLFPIPEGFYGQPSTTASVWDSSAGFLEWPGRWKSNGALPSLRSSRQEVQGRVAAA